MKKLVSTIGALLCAGSAFAFMPQTGTWIVSSENNGQPGRGFGLDVQNSTLVMQMYGYEANGAPTFYLSAGPITNNTYTGQLNQYANGQSFGSAQHPGQEIGSAGTVKMRFVSGTKGYITFPNEPEKEISRFSFGYTEVPQSLIGTWAYMGFNATTQQLSAYLVPLSVISGAVATTQDGKVGCKFTGAEPGEVVCIWIENGQTTSGTIFKLSVNDGDGYAGPSISNLNSKVIVRRVTNPGGDLLGVALSKNAAQEAQNNIAVLEKSLDEAVSWIHESRRSR